MISEYYIKKIDRSYMLESPYSNTMNTIRECRHCGREFFSMKDEFCSFNCVTESTS